MHILYLFGANSETAKILYLIVLWPHLSLKVHLCCMVLVVWRMKNVFICSHL
jgi:hypothetical protein